MQIRNYNDDKTNQIKAKIDNTKKNIYEMVNHIVAELIKYVNPINI